jgi:hypothetical protein
MQKLSLQQADSSKVMLLGIVPRYMPHLSFPQTLGCEAIFGD